MNVDLFNLGEVVECNAVKFAEACMSLWPGRELTIELPPDVDEEALCSVFRAFGCEAMPVAA